MLTTDERKRTQLALDQPKSKLTKYSLEKKHKQLRTAYTEIVSLEEKKSDLNSTLEALEYELEGLDEDTLVPYLHSGSNESAFRKGVELNKILTGLIILVGILISDYLSTKNISAREILSNPFRYIVFPSLLGAAAGVLVNLARSCWYSVSFKYDGIPFNRVEAASNYGYLLEIENDGARGRYNSRFFSNPFYYSEVKINFFVRKKNIPTNAQKIESIKKQIVHFKDDMKILEDRYSKKIEQKKTLVEKFSRLTNSEKSSETVFNSMVHQPDEGSISKSQDLLHF